MRGKGLGELGLVNESVISDERVQGERCEEGG